MAQMEAEHAQVKNIGTALRVYIKENANPDLVKQIVDAISSIRDQLDLLRGA